MLNLTKLQQVPSANLIGSSGGVAQPENHASSPPAVSSSPIQFLRRDPSEKDCAEVSLAALLMPQVQMSAAHEGKFMKASSFQAQSNHPSQANLLASGKFIISLLLGKWVWPSKCASSA